MLCLWYLQAVRFGEGDDAHTRRQKARSRQRRCTATAPLSTTDDARGDDSYEDDDVEEAEEEAEEAEAEAVPSEEAVQAQAAAEAPYAQETLQKGQRAHG